MPTVTGKVYNHSKRMKEKRAVLNGVSAELRRIILVGEEAKGGDAGFCRVQANDVPISAPALTARLAWQIPAGAPSSDSAAQAGFPLRS